VILTAGSRHSARTRYFCVCVFKSFSPSLEGL